MFEKKVSERQKLAQLEALRDAQNELYLISREIQLADAPIPLEQIFYKHNTKAMAAAKLYHECMLLGIPCVLKPLIKIGTVDAIIEINGKYAIIELDQNLIFHEKWKEFDLDTPLIFLTDHHNIPKFLSEICTVKLSHSVFSYHNARLKLLKLRLIHNSGCKEIAHGAT